MNAPGQPLDAQVAELAALAEPVRRALYLYVVSRADRVTRDEAAHALGISRGLAAFHLDKLVGQGLLEASYQRLTGRSGPGAGRPAKLYRRSGRRLEVTIPPRRFELLGRLLAAALDEGDGSVPPTLANAACEFGRRLGGDVRELAGTVTARDDVLHVAETILRENGFEPVRDERGDIWLHNCPFAEIAAEHRQLVCGMNLALMTSFVGGLELPGTRTVLDPQPGRCCVRFTRADPTPQ